MDLVAVSEVVAGLVAAGAGKELTEDVGRGLVTAVVERVRKLFGHDHRSLDALEQAQQVGSAAVADLAAALRWYAERDAAFAAELARWAKEALPTGGSQQVHAGRDAIHGGS
jgi:N-acetylglucosamine kinase-like BadF-type ATPase